MQQQGLRDAGFLECLTPDEFGVLNRWVTKYIVIQRNSKDENDENASLLVYNHPSDEIAEAEVSLLRSELAHNWNKQLTKPIPSLKDSIDTGFSITTEDGLRLYLKAKNIEDLRSWVLALENAIPMDIETQQRQRKLLQESIINPLPPNDPPPPSSSTFMTDQQVLNTTASSSNKSKNKQHHRHHHQSGLDSLIAMADTPRSACGYLYAFDSVEGWREVFAMVAPGDLLLFRHASDKSSLLGTYSLTLAKFKLVPNPPKEQIQVSCSNGQTLFLMGVDAIDTHRWMKTLARRSVESGKEANSLTLADMAEDSSIFMRRVALAASTNLTALDTATHSELAADALSFIAVGALKEVEAGSVAKFDIRCAILHDKNPAYGHLDGGDFQVFLTHSDDFDGMSQHRAIGHVSASASGLIGSAPASAGGFSAQISHSVAGRYRLHVLLGKCHIFGSPFPFHIFSGPASPVYSTITGAGATSAILDQPVTFTITLRDRFLNLALVPQQSTQNNSSGGENDPFTAILDGIRVQVSSHNAIINKIQRIDSSGGTSYDVTYTTKLHGKSKSGTSLVRLEVSLNGIAIAGSPIIPQTEGADSHGELLRKEPALSNLAERNIPVFGWMAEEKDAIPEFENLRYERENLSQSAQSIKKSAEYVLEQTSPDSHHHSGKTKKFHTQEAISRAVDTAVDAHDAASSALAAAKAVALRSDRAALMLTRLYRDEFNSDPTVTYLDDEKLGLIMGSSGVRTAQILETFELINDDGTKVTYKREVAPAPWAPISSWESYLRRLKQRLKETLDPLIHAIQEECQRFHITQPHAAWKRQLLAWNGSEATTHQLSELRISFLESPLEHRLLVADMIERIIECESNIQLRKLEAASEKNKSQTDAAAMNKASLDAKRMEFDMISARRRLYGNRDLSSYLENENLSNNENGNEGEDDGFNSNNIFATGESQKELTSEETMSSSLLPDGIITLPRIGSRVLITSSQAEGVVKFFGPVQFAPGNWVGIDLDQPMGKNDGSVMGIRYFECEKNLGLKLSEYKFYGIFTRPERVQVIDPIPSKAAQISRKLEEPTKSAPMVPIYNSNEPLPSKQDDEYEDKLPSIRSRREEKEIPIVSSSRSNSKNESQPLDEKRTKSSSSLSSPPRAQLASNNNNNNNNDNTNGVVMSANKSVFQEPAPIPASPLVAKSMTYPNTPEWNQIERWLDSQKISRLYERKAVLDSFLSHGVTNLQRVSRLNGDTINRMPLSFDLRMKILSGSRSLANQLLFESKTNGDLNQSAGLSPVREALASSLSPTKR